MASIHISLTFSQIKDASITLILSPFPPQRRGGRAALSARPSPICPDSGELTLRLPFSAGRPRTRFRRYGHSISWNRETPYVRRKESRFPPFSAEVLQKKRRRPSQGSAAGSVFVFAVMIIFAICLIYWNNRKVEKYQVRLRDQAIPVILRFFSSVTRGIT